MTCREGMAISCCSSFAGWRLACGMSCMLLLLHTVIGALPEEAVFVPGTLPLDTDGEEVPALHPAPDFQTSTWV